MINDLADKYDVRVDTIIAEPEDPEVIQYSRDKGLSDDDIYLVAQLIMYVYARKEGLSHNDSSEITAEHYSDKLNLSQKYLDSLLDQFNEK